MRTVHDWPSSSTDHLVFRTFKGIECSKSDGGNHVVLLAGDISGGNALVHVARLAHLNVFDCNWERRLFRLLEIENCEDME